MGSPYAYQSGLGAGSTPASSVDMSTELTNLALATSVSGNALTIALKGKDGNDPSVSNVVSLGFRSATITSGIYAQRTVTSALSVVVSSGSTLGTTSAVAATLYVYAIDNGGTVELGVCNGYLDEGQLQSSTAEGGAGAADSAVVLYSTTARASKAIRIIGRIIITEATAGTWASNATELAVQPFPQLRPGSLYYSAYYPQSTSNYWTTTNTGAYADFTVVGTIPNPTVMQSNGFTVAKATSSLPGINFVAPRTGVIKLVWVVNILPGQQAAANLGSIKLHESTTTTDLGFGTAANTLGSTTSPSFPVTVTGHLSVTAGTTYNVKIQGTIGGNTLYIGAFTGGTAISIAMEYIS